ncbi:glycosyltransferase, partial [Xanthomonas citri pv. citri]|nr:glycosyltransferase [Xanthomonas citri pv. citri]
VILAGYVDGLGEALRQHRGFLSPVLSGAGVKTKVLDAMSVGLPVAATPLGVEGIPVTAGVDALVGDTTEELVEHIRALMEQ